MTKKFILLFIVLILTSCSSNNTRVIRRPILNNISENRSNIIKSDVKKAPWEVWDDADYGNSSIKSGNRLSREGKLTEALTEYQNSISLAKNSSEAEMSILMLCSTLLKLGQGKESLNAITKYAIKRNVDAGQLDSRFSLITGYSYIQLGDIIQSIAWLKQSYVASSLNSTTSNEAKRAIKQILRTQNTDSLNSLKVKWNDDNLVSSLIVEEKERRYRGGSQLSFDSFNEYFEKTRYSIPTTPNILKSNFDEQNIKYNDIKLGVMLPITGQYSSHSEKIIKGIELARVESGLSNELYKEDTMENGVVSSYTKLAKSNGVNIVFGPLTTKDVEDVSSISANLGVPVLTYAKKKGLPELSYALYRLGATPENQINEAYRFVNESYNIEKIIILLPDDELGAEYNEAVENLNKKFAVSRFQKIFYSIKNSAVLESSLDSAIESAIYNKPNAIMVVDSPFNVSKLIEKIKNRSELQNVKLLGSAITADLKQLQKTSSGLFDGMFVTSLFNPNSSQYQVTKFVNDYVSLNGEQPDLLAAQSYDSAKFILSAFKNFDTANLRSNEVKAPDAYTEHNGVTGKLIMNPTGDIYRKIRISKIINNNLIDAE